MKNNNVKIKRALISVSDKTNLIEFARGLSEVNIEIISTGGTSQFLRDANIPVTDVSDETQFPEIMDGRLKTLHPKVHGGILGKRDTHSDTAQKHGISWIDLVVVNLYPFAATIKKPDVTFEEAIENIDIGGPAMIRSAAKNMEWVGVVVDPNDYVTVLSELRSNGSVDFDTRRRLATKAFAHTAQYDALINGYLETGEKSTPLPFLPPQGGKGHEGKGLSLTQHGYCESLPLQGGKRHEGKGLSLTQHGYGESLPLQGKKGHEGKGLSLTQPGYGESLPPLWGKERKGGAFLTIHLEKFSELRYGENPHQNATAYRFANENAGILSAIQHQGKQLSYNNIADADAAMACVNEFEGPACVIVKHANPCGAAAGTSIFEAFQNAFYTDEQSAFGGIVALNRMCTQEIAEALTKVFIEVIIAPAYDQAALEILSRKNNLRVLELPQSQGSNQEFKFVKGGLLVQDKDKAIVQANDLSFVTKIQPQAEEIDSLLFAWRIVRHIKSNAILLAKQNATLGIGAGQVSRIDAVDIALRKAGTDLSGAVLASDAFFPFRDSIDKIAGSGIRAIIQPGGSMRDEEVIAACNEHKIAMVFTGQRCFKH